MSTQTKGLAALLAAQGRNGDDELIHVNKREIAALERLGRRHGIETTTNPRTGLKEAFNWLSTLGGIAGGVAGTFIAPGAGTAAGAALGSGLGTKAGGGSTEEALTNGMISGVTAWAGAGLADSLAQAGAEAGKAGVQEGAKELVQEGAKEVVQEGAKEVVQEGVKTGVQEGLQNTAVQNLSTAATQATPVTTPLPTALPQGTPLPQGIEAFAKPDASAMASIDPGYYGAENVGTQGVNTYSAADTSAMRAAAPEVAPSGITSIGPGQNTLSASGTNPEYWSNVRKGIGSLDTPSKAGEFAVANKGNLIGTATGIAGIATAPESSSTADESTGDSYTGPSYRGEVYYTPYGERRTRAVPYAGGGEVWGDYDGVEDEHATGGLMGYADGGGIGFIRSMQPGGEWGDMTADIYGAVQEHKPQWLQNIEPGGFIGATAPGKMDWEEKKRKEEEEKKRMQMGVNMASGGISSLGSYSDGGQLLRGPGDGVSDNIPASIEGQRPARLAEGEFVIPARAVSELGNGSTEAGSKQLYAMLDRIAKKRKKGNGLAYQANPKKLMPV